MRDDRLIDRTGMLFLMQDEYEHLIERAEQMALDTSNELNTPLEVFALMREAGAIMRLKERFADETKHAPSINTELRETIYQANYGDAFAQGAGSDG